MVCKKTKLFFESASLLNFKSLLSLTLFAFSILVFSMAVNGSQAANEANVEQPKLESKDFIATSETQQEANQLEIAIALQDLKITELEKKLNKQVAEIENNGISFGVWIGILLACIAILLTIFGLGLAVLSFFGYRKVIESAATSARAAAIEVAEKTVGQLVSSATEKEIISLIDKGKFNTIISHAVNNVVYRGINAVEDFDDNEKL
jgi:hypothetical protein